jgi:hypothetical protein
LLIMLINFNKNYRNNRNISIFTSISYHSVFTRPPFLFSKSAMWYQHNQQCDILLPIVPCTHKLKAGIAYWYMHSKVANVYNRLFAYIYKSFCVYITSSFNTSIPRRRKIANKMAIGPLLGRWHSTFGRHAAK